MSTGTIRGERFPSMARGHRTAQLGKLVAAAFDRAARYSEDPREVSRLAVLAVSRLLWLERKRREAPV